MRNVEELREAADVYEHGWFLLPSSPNALSYVLGGSPVRLADPTNNDAKMKLAEIYEIMGEPRKALDLVYQGNSGILPPFIFFSQVVVVIDSRKKRGKSNATNQTEDTTNPSGTSLFSEDKTTHKSKARVQNRLTHAQLRELEVQKEKEVVKGHRRLKELWSDMLAGEKDSEREWLVEAEKLIDMFRETRNLFVTSRVCCLFKVV